MSSCGLKDQGAVVVATSLTADECTIRGAILRANHIGAPGAAAVGHALSRNRSVTLLDMSANQLTDRGVIALARGNATPTPLAAAAAPAGAPADAAAGAQAPSLAEAPAEEATVPRARRRRLAAAAPAEEAAAAPRSRRGRRELAEVAAEEEAAGGLEKNGTLRTLLLSNNALTYHSFESLAAALTNHAALTDLDLSINKFEGDSDTSTVPDKRELRAIARGKSDAEVAADEQWLWPKAIDSLGKFLRTLPGLTRLKMQYYGEVRPASAARLRAAAG